MKQFTFRRWMLEVDSDRTRAIHGLLSAGGAEGCDCNNCENFLAVREELFRGEFADLLGELGIDLRRDAEVWRYVRLSSGLHSYGGIFHAVGGILDGADGVRQTVSGTSTDDFELISPQLSIGLCRGCDLVREPFQGLTLFQVAFQGEVPWLISAPEPD